jgi:hypothetical protein
MKSILFLFCLIVQDAELAKKCGSEVPWTWTLEKALEKARAEKKPVCWFVPSLDRSPMDRKSVIEHYMEAGPFMSEDVIEILSEYFVPLQLYGRGKAVETYNLKPLEFIGPGLLFLSPDGKLLHRMDRLYTYNEEWFSEQLFFVLARNVWEERLKKEQDPLERARLFRRLRKPEAVRRELEKAGPTPEAVKEQGILAVKEHRYTDAEKLFDGLEDPEAKYLLGCVYHRTLRQTKAYDLWREVEKQGGRWAWKAASELRRDGPFSRGFEEIGWLPEDAYGKKAVTSDLPRSTKEWDTIIRRGVEHLLRMQKSNGVWNDSNYDFAGVDSLPDVYVTGTALSAWALHLWRDVAPDRIDNALNLADAYLSDEKNIATANEKERSWAHLYRILYFAECGRQEEKLKEIAGTLRSMQMRNGDWYHEYPNAFVSASVLHALHRAKKAGAEIEDAVFRRGAEALKRYRNPQGLYAYDSRMRKPKIQGAAGRMPMCEYALYLNGGVAVKNVEHAIAKAFEHHGWRERVRKYDNHADKWGNGGFFFYYDLLGISFAADALPQKKRKAVHAKLREIVLSIGELDGSWQDSHELGRSYGTAMALIILKRAGK